MEQRRLRLGDILDDYCPRERRVTNHAVVAMIEENVKQTRCTTCDAEHAYKGARVPKRRKKETPAALYKEVLAGMTEVEEAPLLAAAVPAVVVPAAVLPSVPAAVLAVQVEAPVQRAPIAETSSPVAAPQIVTERSPAAPLSEIAVASADVVEAPDEAPVVDGPVHRALIRATLPRVEGQKEVRTPPDFTARHIPARGAGHGGFRGDRDRMRVRGSGGAGNGNGNSQGNAYGHGNANANRGPGAPRFQGNRPSGQGRPAMGGRAGGGPGFRNGNGSGNGNKRGRGSRG
jgi:hypothetical protein